MSLIAVGSCLLHVRDTRGDQPARTAWGIFGRLVVCLIAAASSSFAGRAAELFVHSRPKAK